MIKVSILIPAYNQQELIVRCLDSIPDRDDVEVIVTDDGSTDDTLKVISSYNKLKNLKIFSTINHGVPGPATNICIDNSSGEYIMYVDDDDYIYTDVFIDILDNISKYNYYDIIETLQEKNDGEKWISKWTYRGCLIKRAFLGDLRHNNSKSHDTTIRRELEKKNPKTIVFDKSALYHYNYPREGSIMWNRGFRG